MDLELGSVRLEGYIDVPVKELETVREALKDHIRLTRQEPGCLYFQVTPDESVPCRFTVSEAFVDEEAFRTHQSRAKNSPWAKASADVSRHYRSWVVK